MQTLDVELKAQNRSLKQIKRSGMVALYELYGANKLLYVVGVMELLNAIWLLSPSRDWLRNVPNSPPIDEKPPFQGYRQPVLNQIWLVPVPDLSHDWPCWLKLVDPSPGGGGFFRPLQRADWLLGFEAGMTVPIPMGITEPLGLHRAQAPGNATFLPPAHTRSLSGRPAPSRATSGGRAAERLWHASRSQSQPR